ncbi:MAG: UDP-N-acetylmuramoyl-L-alanyl-D-glutamate--2,6-diaminopimelate ligase, partial [Anaerolineae bacterium]|nr:UDP-N-acetylmuramoyl-L-alanyl-D-glutamate--2,6-diaminopimelate ligase [Anaerolineae bacterium]
VGWLAAAYHDFPSRKLTVIGVTGTDGKTTTSTLIYTLLGKGCGLISTISADVGDTTLDTGFHVTTPGAPMIQALLARMVANGLSAAVLEITSHGLAQGRLNGVDIDVAVLTNVTHEHLDYHGTFEDYRAAKGRMFAMLSQSYRKPNMPKVSVINADDPSADYFAAFPADKVVTYGIYNAQAQWRAIDIRYQPSGTTFNINTGIHWWETSLVGEFNVYNCLAAIETVFCFSVPYGELRRSLAKVQSIPGRMERIDAGQDFLALVDFAHTPNALENALKAARKMVGAGGRLIATFGSAGLRDRDKRRMMPEVAARLADFTILTTEDPRTESLAAILETMAQAAAAAGGIEGETFIRVPDRGEALYRACQMAHAGDVVIACGKGHEQSMAFGTVEYPWDDRDAMRAALRGSPLRTLPTATKDSAGC